MSCTEFNKRFRVFCRNNKCLLITVFVIGFTLLWFGAATHHVVTKKLNQLERSNVTFNDEELADFYETLEIPSEIKEKLPQSFAYDKKNQPVWFMEFGEWDLASLMDDNSTVQMVNHYIDRSFYLMRKRMQAIPVPANNGTPGWVFVCNMDGFSVSKAFDFKVSAFLQEMLTKYYSSFKTLDYSFVVNMSTWTRIVLAVLKPFLGDTVAKFEVFGSYYWLDELLQRIDKDQVPPDYITRYSE